MSVVVADTGPIHYLLLIGQIDLLPALFECVVIPLAVRDEMLDPKTPNVVREWIANPPSWLQRVPNPSDDHDLSLAELDEGERSAVRLAISLNATLVLMDDRAGVIAAKRKGLLVTGTLGILDLAAVRGLVDIQASIQRLMTTNFRYSQALIDRVLEPYQKKDERL